MVPDAPLRLSTMTCCPKMLKAPLHECLSGNSPDGRDQRHPNLVNHRMIAKNLRGDGRRCSGFSCGAREPNAQAGSRLCMKCSWRVC
jgi:hypothetical protein